MLSLDLLKIPNHIAVIMDGNGRWAKSQGKDRLFGHAAGVEAVRDTLKAAKEFGVVVPNKTVDRSRDVMRNRWIFTIVALLC